MNGLSSNESFIKSQESMVQGAMRTPKSINLLKTEFNHIINKYNASENARINRKPAIKVNDGDYDQNSKEQISRIRREQRKRRSKKTDRKLDVEEHERALNELKKFAFIMDSSNTISKKSHSRDEDEDDDLDIYLGHSSSSENSSKSNSSTSLNITSCNHSINIVIEAEDNKEDKKVDENTSENGNENATTSKESLGILNIPKKSQNKLVIPSRPTPMFKNSLINIKNDVYFSREDVFKKNNAEEDEQSLDKEDYDDEEKRLNDKKKKSRLKQFLKLHKENFLLEMPNALYTDIISESIKILTKTSQNYTSQLGKKDESTVGSIKHLEHLKSMIPSGNQYQQHIDNNSSKFGPGYYQLCAPIDENGQYVQLKEKVLINSLESLNSNNSLNK